MRLNLSADEVLATTRSVRKRLDFDRPVEREIVMECLELALQAPTGSNRQGWQWMFVTDDHKKRALQEIYSANFEGYRKMARPTYEEGDIRAERADKVVDSAQYLSDNFHRRRRSCSYRASKGSRPTAARRAPASGGRCCRPCGASCWPSVSEASARRGRRSTSPTAATSARPQILGIPHDRFSQAGLFPIAYTQGVDFKPAKRLPAEEVTHWDEW